jgi:hypothetical protein
MFPLEGPQTLGGNRTKWKDQILAFVNTAMFFRFVEKPGNDMITAERDLVSLRTMLLLDSSIDTDFIRKFIVRSIIDRVQDCDISGIS